MKPCECERIRDVLALDRSHVSNGRWDMMIQHDGAVVLTEHRLGEKMTARIVIPRRTFQKMIAWYETEQGSEVNTMTSKCGST